MKILVLVELPATRQLLVDQHFRTPPAWMMLRILSNCRWQHSSAPDGSIVLHWVAELIPFSTPKWQLMDERLVRSATHADGRALFHLSADTRLDQIGKRYQPEYPKALFAPISMR